MNYWFLLYHLVNLLCLGIAVLQDLELKPESTYNTDDEIILYNNVVE